MTDKLAVIILTHNEERHIARCLKSIGPVAHEVYVVDSGSTDATRDIAEALGAKVLQRAFRNQADQFQWALDNITTDATWIMRLDADEVVEKDLADRIRSDLPRLDADVVGINIDRKHIFMGRWIKHGGRYPLTLLRIFRRGFGRIEQRWMDEHLVVTGGRTVHLGGGFADHNLNDLTFFTDKHNKYATREAIDVLNSKFRFFGRDSLPEDGTTTRQATLKRWIKERLYNKLPFPLSSSGYFLYRYLLRLGFLDGYEGFVYHFLQGFWYRFLVGAKLRELEREIAGLSDKHAIASRLSELTGLRIE